MGDIIFDVDCDRVATTGPCDSTSGFYAIEDAQNVEAQLRRLFEPEAPKKMTSLTQLPD